MFFGCMLGLLLITGCTGNATTDQTVADVIPSQGVSSSGNVKEFTVKAFRFGFEPSVISVSQGDTVRIIADTVDVPHGLAIEGYGINLYLNGLKPQIAEFVADKSGTFAMYCSVPCGSGHSSMRGTLVVN